jgi:hypothetical protein
MTMIPRKARVYLQIRDKYPKGSSPSGVNATVVKATTQPPATIEHGCVVVCIDVEVDRALWETAYPAALVAVTDTQQAMQVSVGTVDGTTGTYVPRDEE